MKANVCSIMLSIIIHRIFCTVLLFSNVDKVIVKYEKLHSIFHLKLLMKDELPESFDNIQFNLLHGIVLTEIFKLKNSKSIRFLKNHNDDNFNANIVYVSESSSIPVILNSDEKLYFLTFVLKEGAEFMILLEPVFPEIDGLLSSYKRKGTYFLEKEHISKEAKDVLSKEFYKEKSIFKYLQTIQFFNSTFDEKIIDLDTFDGTQKFTYYFYINKKLFIDYIDKDIVASPYFEFYSFLDNKNIDPFEKLPIVENDECLPENTLF